MRVGNRSDNFTGRKAVGHKAQHNKEVWSAAAVAAAAVAKWQLICQPPQLHQPRFKMRHEEDVVLQNEYGTTAAPRHVPQGAHVTDAARHRALTGFVHEGVEVAVDDSGVKGGLG